LNKIYSALRSVVQSVCVCGCIYSAFVDVAIGLVCGREFVKLNYSRYAFDWVCIVIIMLQCMVQTV